MIWFNNKYYFWFKKFDSSNGTLKKGGIPPKFRCSGNLVAEQFTDAKAETEIKKEDTVLAKLSTVSKKETEASSAKTANATKVTSTTDKTTKFSNCNRAPDSVDPEKQWKQQNHCHLEDQCSEKRDQRREQTVVQCGKKCRAINIEPVDQERKAVQTEPTACQFKKPLVITDKQCGEWCCDELRDDK